jgi:hypothetical protein
MNAMYLGLELELGLGLVSSLAHPHALQSISLCFSKLHLSKMIHRMGVPVRVLV